MSALDIISRSRRRRTGNSPFKITDVVAPALWLPPGYATTGSTFTWADQSGNGRNGSATGAARPTIVTSDSNYNGAQSQTYDGSANFLAVASFALAQPFSVLVVGHSTDVSATRMALSHFVGGVEVDVECRSGAAGLYANGAAFLTTAGNWNVPSVALFIVNGASSTIYLNSHTVTASGTNPGTAGYSSGGTMYVGCFNSALNFWKGTIAEIAVCPGDQTANAAKIMNGSGKNYNLVIS